VRCPKCSLINGVSFFIFYCVVMSQEYLVFLNDFSVNQGPEGNGRRFYMTSSEGSSGSNNSLSSSGNSNTLRTPSKSAFQRVKLWAANESKTRYCSVLKESYSLGQKISWVSCFLLKPQLKLTDKNKCNY
jgi:hypothetical protein